MRTESLGEVRCLAGGWGVLYRLRKSGGGALQSLLGGGKAWGKHRRGQARVFLLVFHPANGHEKLYMGPRYEKWV